MSYNGGCNKISKLHVLPYDVENGVKEVDRVLIAYISHNIQSVEMRIACRRGDKITKLDVMY